MDFLIQENHLQQFSLLELANKIFLSNLLIPHKLHFNHFVFQHFYLVFNHMFYFFYTSIETLKVFVAEISTISQIVFLY